MPATVRSGPSGPTIEVLVPGDAISGVTAERVAMTECQWDFNAGAFTLPLTTADYTANPDATSSSFSIDAATGLVTYSGTPRRFKFTSVGTYYGHAPGTVYFQVSHNGDGVGSSVLDLADGTQQVEIQVGASERYHVTVTKTIELDAGDTLALIVWVDDVLFFVQAFCTLTIESR